MINLNESLNNNRFTFRNSSQERLHFTPGIWVNGKCFWLQNISEKILYEEQMIFKVRQEQIHSKISLSHLYIYNHSNMAKELKILAMHHHSPISHEHFSFASPNNHHIIHLVNNVVFMVNGQCNGIGMKEYTIQPYWNVFTDQIWISQKKGILRYQPMSKGPVASIFTLEAFVKAHGTVKLNTWIIKGKSKSELMILNQALLKNTLAFQSEK